MQRVRAYLHILKPGITISNTIAAVAGLLLGVSVMRTVHIVTWLSLALGIAAVIGSACAANNVLDEKIDRKMKRTKRREVVTGVIGRRQAIVYSAVLGMIGFGLIFLGTNILTGILGLIAYLTYVVIYGAAKRTTIWSTVVGTVPGALPPVAGYAAVTGRLDAAALVIFVMMTLWQLAHFYAIAMFRRDEYAAAGLPIWSVSKGLESTRRQLYIAAWLFVLTAPLLTLLGVTHVFYMVAMTATALWWVATGWRLYDLDAVKWARKMFGVSLVVLLVMCALWAVGGFLP